MSVAPAAGAPFGIDEQSPDRTEREASRSRAPRSEQRGGPPASDRAGPAWIVLVLWALLALPVAVALVVLSSKHWVPLGDIAQTELRVRDVWSSHPPLIGLAGRIGPFSHQGSHPGPLSFWSLWPFYRLFGASPIALVSAGATLQLLAVGGALWLAYRRGGVRVAIGAAAVLALLMRSYGSVTLTEPWNPYLPVMWWFLFLVAVWSVLCDDLVALPVAVFAGSFCMQTHISYLGLIGGLSLLLIGGWGRAVHARRDDPPRRRQALWWGLAGLVLGIVLWIPPVIDQLTTKPGNATVIWRHFTKPPEAAAGVGKGFELLLVPLNPWWWIKGHQAVQGSIVPGLLVLASWIAAIAFSWRVRHRALMRLHVVVGVGLVLGLISAAKIFGPIFNYLLLWDWGLCALLFLAVGWTLGVAVGHRLRTPQRDRAWLSATAGLAAATVLVVAVFTVDAGSTEFRAARPSEILRRVVGPTAAALDRGRVPGGGRSGRYLVTWTDPIAIGTQGFGLISELERRGFDVGAEAIHEGGVAPHRVMKRGKYTAVVHLSVGQDVATWQAKPGVRRVAYVDLRTPRERAEYARLRLLVIAGLEAAHLRSSIPLVDGNLYGASINPAVPRRTFKRMVRMLDLGLPTAVFVGPPSSAP